MSDAVIHSLEPHFYTGSDHYEREVDRLMAKAWLFAGHVSSLPAVGDYFAVELAGESLFCVRSAEDAVKCYYNVCQHRGHQLVRGEGNARFIVCPYHSWTYELDGRFKSAPNLRVLKDFDRGVDSPAGGPGGGFLWLYLCQFGYGGAADGRVVSQCRDGTSRLCPAY